MAPNAEKALANNTINKPFKQRKSFEIRKGEVEGIRAKFPTKIPVVVERYKREVNLPLLDKTKFLVPQELTMSNFTQIIRNRLILPPGRSFYFVINNKSIISNSKPISEIYKDNKDEDGFLYMTYASQEMFGSSSHTGQNGKSSTKCFSLMMNDPNRMDNKILEKSSIKVINLVQLLHRKMLDKIGMVISSR